MTADPLEPLREAPVRSALVFDVDGTLAPIALRPALAEVPAETKRVLAALVERYLLVACLSGRAREDARRLVGVDGIRYVGNHGLDLDPQADALAAQVAAFRDQVARPVEDKGLTLAYHFRGVADEAAARAELEHLADLAREEGLVARWGRKVLEIRPPAASDKGTAVTLLLRESGASRALYAGDDTTDVDAFRALATAGLEHLVRVAVDSVEAPRELTEGADLVLDGPEELARLLVRL